MSISVVIITRSEKGAPLSFAEMDANLTNLETAFASFTPLTGEGATGTWAIDISGIAQTANVAEIANNVSGTVAIANGGTGGTTAAQALSNLGGYPSANPLGFVTAATSPVQSVGGLTGVISLTQLNLDQVNNTSDVNKPLSTATTNALAMKESLSNKNAPNGYVGLSNYGIVLQSVVGVNVIQSQISSIAAATRTYTFPDKNITVAGLADITGTNSGVNTGDETASTIKNKLGITTLSGSNTGDETQTTILNKLGVSTLSGNNTGDQTLASLGIPNVENKSAATILSELTASNIQTALTYMPLNPNLLGAPNGISTLDSNGKVPTSQLPNVITGAVVYQGVWNANTNTPTLTSGVGTQGWYYKVSVAGSTNVDGNNVWNVADTIIFDGTTWDKLDGPNSTTGGGGGGSVISVAGRSGVVTLSQSDITGLTISDSPKFVGVGFNNGAITSINTSLSANTAGQAIDSFDITVYRKTIYDLCLTNGSNYHVGRVTLWHDGTIPYIMPVEQQWNTASLGTFDTSLSGNTLSLLFNPVNANTTIKAVRTAIVV